MLAPAELFENRLWRTPSGSSVVIGVGFNEVDLMAGRDRCLGRDFRRIASTYRYAFDRSSCNSLKSRFL